MKQRYLHTLASCALVFSFMSLYGQYGGVDASFNPLDDGTYGDGPLRHHTSYSPPTAEISGVFELPDGRIMISGQTTTYNGVRINKPIRVFPDGRLDPTYSPAWPSGWWVGSMAFLPDGGVLVSVSNSLRRIGPAGVIDPDFNVPVNNTILAIAVLPDGRIIIGGMFTQVDGEDHGHIARLLPDGTLDPEFDAGTGSSNRVSVLRPMPDGGLLIGGSFNMVDGVARNGVARLLADGALDPDYDPMVASTGTFSVGGLVIDGQGRALVGGNFQPFEDGVWHHLLRFLPNGQVDPTFTPGMGPSSGVGVILPLPDGRILIGGGFSSYDGTPCKAIARLMSDGLLDPGFTANLDHAYGPLVGNIVVAANGDLLVGGRFSSVEGRFRMAFTRLTADGAMVEEFNPGRGVGGLVRGMGLMTDGRIAIAGDFISYNDTPRPYLAFLDSYSAMHPQFDGGEGPNGRVTLMAPMPGDRIFLAGDFTMYDGVPVPRMAVIDAYGALDPNVALPDIAPTGFRFTAAHALPDGGLLVAFSPEQQPLGFTSTLNRLLPNGEVDPAFAPPTPITGGILALAVQPDGRLLLGGSFTLPGSSARGIARLLPDGGMDNSFSPGVGVAPATNSGVYTITPLSDGRIMIGGWFTHYRGGTAGSIACLNPDGTRYSGFSNLGVTSAYSMMPPSILSIQPLPDGRLVLSGWFNTYGGAPHNGMAIALPDGTQDPSFSIGAGPNYLTQPYIHQVLVDPVGNYLIRGLFDRIDDVARHRIARLHGGGGVGMEERSAQAGLYAWPNPTMAELFTSAPVHGDILDVQGRTVRTVQRTNRIDVRALQPGTYILRSSEGSVLRFVKQ